MAASTSAFSSRLGFILAAAGSAVGLGNIWGFPTQAASNGGGAFLLVYLVLVFVLAYPMLVAELTIGYHRQSNPVAALRDLSDVPFWRRAGVVSALTGLTVLSLLLSFYAIIAGWLFAYMAGFLFELAGLDAVAKWLTEFSDSRNLSMMLGFMLLTIFVVRAGVKSGIERWSRLLMPVLVLLLIGMAAYILTLPGAMEGLEHYLIPDISRVLDANLLLSATGQAFFSFSIGVCVMMTYGSYLPRQTNLPKAAASVALIDTGIAFLAGLLILPAMFVAEHQGVTIYADDGSLLSSDTLIFNVLPSMFDTMGNIGLLAGSVFFALLVIAALTSTISMLEAPVNAISQELEQPRHKMVWVIGGAVCLISTLIVFNFGTLFGFVVTLTTVYMQPLLALVFALLLSWVLHRNALLKTLKEGNPQLENSWFWKIWPWYVKFICPVLILLVFIQ